MKLQYTLLTGALLLAGGALAQLDQRQNSNATLCKSTGIHHTPNTSAIGGERDGGDVVFNEDFANGLSGNNGFGAWTQSGPNGNIWRHSTAGPYGAWTDRDEIITSATADNGFMLFNSDSANTNWSDTSMVASPVNFDGSLESPLLDLSATPYVELEFQTYFRFCCQDAPFFVEVSADGGNNWNTQFDAGEGVAANDGSGTITRKFNITGAISSDPSNVKFRFRHNPDAGSSHYQWQVDDVKLVEVYEYDLRVTNVANTLWDINTAGTYDSLPYSIFPFSQLRPLSMNMTVLNNGSEMQDAVANFTVTRSGTTVLDQDQDVTALAPGEIRTVVVEPMFTPPAEAGTYQVDYSLTSDSTDLVPEDNSGSSSFQVSEFIYGRDAGAPFTWETGDEVTMILGNMFHVYAPATLYSVSVKIGSGSEVGSFVVGQLREDDLDTVVDETPEYELTTQMMSSSSSNTMTELVFANPIELLPGTDYFIGIYTFGNVRIGQSGVSPDQTSFINYQGASGLAWYYTTTTPAVRMNFNPTVGITENDNVIGNVTIMPNPANDIAQLAYHLPNAADVTIELVDMSGKLVMTHAAGKRAAGEHRYQIDTADLEAGMYMYILTADGGKVTGRLSVIK